MVAKILKAIYFPRGTIEAAGVGYQPSYLWRSLLKARKLVEIGTAWRIGNGESVKSFRDKWIGVKQYTRPMHKQARNEALEKVSDFIDPINVKWIEHRVRECFVEDDANIILATPLSQRRPPDKLVWSATPNGKYTVKSAYHLAVTKLSKRGIDLPSTSTKDTMWKKMWHINTPPSVRHFLWRACSNVLPTKEGLVKRGMQIDPACALCGEGKETTSHIFLQCPIAVHSWGQTPIRIDPSDTQKLNFKNFCWNMLEKLPKEGWGLFTAVLWNIWKARNAFYFEEIMPDPKKTAEKAMRQATEWEVKSRSGDRGKQKKETGTRWDPPPAGRYKLNSDAATFGVMVLW